MRNQKRGFARLIEIAGAKKWWLFASMFLSVIATVVQFVPVIVVYEIIAELASHAVNIAKVDSDLLFKLGFISLGSVAIFGVLTYTAYMLSHIAAFNILYEIRVKIAEKLTKLSMGFFNKRASGEIKKVMTEDVERIELFVAHHVPDITSAVVFPIIVIGFLFYMDWRLAIASLIPFPIAMIVMMGMMTRGAKGGYQEYHNTLEKMNAAVVEYVRAMPVVKVFGGTVDSFRSLKDAVFSFKDLSQKITKEYSTTYPAFLTVASSSLIFITPVAAFILKYTGAGANFIQTILLFFIVGGGLFFPLFKLMFMGSYLNQISVGVERIDEILYREELPDMDLGKRPIDTSVEFENVSFAYNDITVLDNVSFRAEPNSVTALVGPSGAGKSTIGSLIARFWDINQGVIRIGGVDIKEMDFSLLMDYVSFVFQDGFLFFDTIEENIRIGNRGATKLEIVEAAKAACCHEFIENLPCGYDTLVGEGGTYLSGGEQQRIGIARAILKNSPIIVLDEATAYTDPENEGKILEAFSRLTSDKTVIVIAHRLSTVVSADSVIIVDNGKIVEQGIHNKLVKTKGLYSSMWDTYSRARTWTIKQKKGGN